VAVNGDKQPATTQSERAIRLRRELPANWDNVSVTAWAGLTVEFCRQHGADVIIRGVRNGHVVHGSARARHLIRGGRFRGSGS
jgi:pantetheine-phosphate adenylyltransferase